MDPIKQVILIASFIALCVTAQYTPPIPCSDDQACVRVLGPDQDPKCMGSVCLCRNSTKLFRLCSSKDLIGGARQGLQSRGVGRLCNTNADCQSIQGAECREEPGDRSRHCVCRPGAAPSPDGQRCLPGGQGPQDQMRNGPQDQLRNGPQDLMRNGPFEGPRNAHHEEARQDSPCTHDAQCSMRVPGMECGPEGRCRCAEGSHKASRVSKCVPNKGFGERCNGEEESCYQPAGPNNENALECANDFACRCANNYVLRDGLCQSSDGSQTTTSILLLLMAFFTVKLF